MSNINGNEDFLSLFLKTTPEQKKALLSSVTEFQTWMINEIFYNLLNIDHKTKDRQFLKNKIGLVKKLSDSKRTIKYRQSLVKKHKLAIVKILDHFKFQLTRLLEER